MIAKRISLLIVVNLTILNAYELGRCPYVRPQTDLDLSKILGKWYEYAKYPIASEALSKCIAVELGPRGPNSISVVRTLTGRLSEIEIGFTGAAVQIQPGVLELKSDGVAGILGNSTLTILGTDYNNYAVAFSCENIFGFGVVHSKHATILTRQRQPGQEAVNNAKEVLQNNGLSVRKLVATNQLNCNSVPANNE